MIIIALIGIVLSGCDSDSPTGPSVPTPTGNLNISNPVATSYCDTYGFGQCITKFTVDYSGAVGGVAKVYYAYSYSPWYEYFPRKITIKGTTSGTISSTESQSQNKIYIYITNKAGNVSNTLEIGLPNCSPKCS